VIELDLFGTFNCCKHAISELIRSGGGSVINLTSMAALMALPGRDCYTAAKGGVASLTRSLAAEYAQHSVRVNAIAPGFVATKRVQSAVSASPALARVVSEHLLGPGEPDDIAHLAVYLASTESRIVTGQIISADSGITIH
jgi:NAD(P)-dependent dehydrogenase (short-subunit alcohol dehydrogenase family)